MPHDGVSEEHCKQVSLAIERGRIVFFLGAGANLCGRDESFRWRPDQSTYLPSGGELADELAETFGYPQSEYKDLARVCQYAALMSGTAALYDELKAVFNADYPPTVLHQFLADLVEARLEMETSNRQFPLIVTTNYDDLVERAFRQAGLKFDLVIYMAEDPYRGRFRHFPPEGQPVTIEEPNRYTDLSLGQRPVILKIHGAVDRADHDDSFVITEDHYIDYLTQTDISGLVPVNLAMKLRRSNFLFLGYGLRDWNLRVILRRLWGQQNLTYSSWAVQKDPHELDRRYWANQGVEILDIELQEYITCLGEHLDLGGKHGAAAARGAGDA